MVKGSREIELQVHKAQFKTISTVGNINSLLNELECIFVIVLGNTTKSPCDENVSLAFANMINGISTNYSLMN